jgi:hypothetical protein
LTKTVRPSVIVLAVSITAFQDRLSRAAGGRSRAVIACKAQDIGAVAWGEEAPLISEWDIRDLGGRLTTVPKDGRKTRAILAALGVPLVDALADMHYWPDLRLGSGVPVTTEDLVLEALRLVGMPNATVVQQGNVLIVQLNRR